MSLSNEQQFLRALTKLSKKHGLYVGGCGCFGSPYLYDKNGQVVIEKVEQTSGHGYLGIDKKTNNLIK